MPAIGAEPEVQDNETLANVNESIDNQPSTAGAPIRQIVPETSNGPDRKHADPTQIAASVRDDDPRIAAPD